MKRIALCLSGGGLRATFFHFGIIHLLRDAKLLASVSHIYSVSGGSILAAHLVANWEEYVGTDEQFAKMQQAVFGLAKQDIRGNAVRRWLLAYPANIFFRFSRLTKFLEYEYAKFLKSLALADLQGVDGLSRPKLHLLTTSFTTGALCSFSNEGLQIWDEDNARAPPLQGGILPLALAVAASSAFPPLFPPVIVTRKMLSGVGSSELPQDPEFLTDGGVFDNLGSQLASRLRQKGFLDVDLLFVSDAGATFDWEIKRRNWWILPRTVRSTNILMKCVTDLTLSQVDTGGLVFPISLNVTQKQCAVALPPDLQRRMSRIRTDLDRFSGIERLLSRHGYSVACQTLRDTAEFDENLKELPVSEYANEVWSGRKLQIYSRKLQRAQRVRVWSLVNFRDWALYAVAVKLAIVAALLIYVPLHAQRTVLLRQVTQPSVRSASASVAISQIPEVRNPDNLTQSKLSTDPIQLAFTNLTDQQVDLFWVDFSGTEIPYAHLAPNQTLQFTSYVGHLWVAKSLSGVPLLIYAVSAPSSG